MDVYKLSVTDIEAKKIDKDAFEGETFCRFPWYQDNVVGKRSQFAVCSLQFAQLATIQFN